MGKKSYPTFSEKFKQKLGRGYYIETCIFRKKDESKFHQIWKDIKEEYYPTPLSKVEKEIRKTLKKVQKDGDAFLRKRIEVTFINEHVGHGLFAKEDIPKGQVLGEYVGMIKRFTPAEDEAIGDSNGYLFEISDLEEFKNVVIDAKTYGNFIRYVNHAKKGSRKENIEAHLYLDEFGPHVVYVSKGIKKGQEARIDYGQESYWDNTEHAMQH